jgi:hypothetical protein
MGACLFANTHAHALVGEIVNAPGVRFGLWRVYRNFTSEDFGEAFHAVEAKHVPICSSTRQLAPRLSKAASSATHRLFLRDLTETTFRAQESFSDIAMLF